MKFKSLFSLLGSAALCAVLAYSVTALAQQPPGGHGPQIPAEKMEAIKACAAAKGVELPAPPPKPPEGEKPPEGKPAEPPKDGHGAPPKLTDAQKAVLDACFKENGVEPPKGPPPHGKKGE